MTGNICLEVTLDWFRMLGRTQCMGTAGLFLLGIFGQVYFDDKKYVDGLFILYISSDICFPRNIEKIIFHKISTYKSLTFLFQVWCNLVHLRRRRSLSHLVCLLCRLSVYGGAEIVWCAGHKWRSTWFSTSISWDFLFSSCLFLR